MGREECLDWFFETLQAKIEEIRERIASDGAERVVGDIAAEAVIIAQTSRIRELELGVSEAAAVIDGTKSEFKSKRLKKLRQDLLDLLSHGE